ncbi:heterokaryon incompatibility protein-domain-containing protein [Xylariaceae sp. FL1651]|nr:heterokaryon incompatibility protein-domain-containing protein [Xylariaceae sp. FL1651]
MEAALCEDCRDLLQSNHNDKLRRFMDSPEHERPVAKVLGAASAGCRLCEAIVNKFRSRQSELLSFAQTNGQPVTFQLIIRKYWNTNLQWEEDIDRPFLQVSISQLQVEFRLWRVTDAPTTKDASRGDRNTGSETSFARAAKWLRQCTMKHDSCNGVNTPKEWAPTRLLDVGLRSPFPNIIKLHQTKSWQTPIQYAALSHCWGAIQPLKLLQGNLHTLMDGILLEDLPMSFQDAIHTTRKLGIQYLWIDSLCIIQDSNEDWDLESSLMTYVYGGCLLNIAAAASNDCTGGLFQNRPSSYLGPCLISVESQNEASISWYQLWDQDLWHTEFETAKLNTRAWVMQERILSPRTLAFTKSQLFWECRCKRASEEFPSEYPMDLFEKWQRSFEQPNLYNKLKVHDLNHHADSRLGDDPLPRLSLAWHNLVMFYSRKDMTFEQDKLVAISGLAILFAQKMGLDYFAGLWKLTLLNDLLWEVNVDTYARHRPLAYRAPSWSWASVECPVKYLPGRVELNRVTVVDVKVNRVPKSQFGRVLGGYLRLQGKLFPNLSIVFDGKSLYSLKRRGLNETSFVASCTPDEKVSSTDAQLELLCLPLASYWDSTRARGGWHYEYRGLVLSPERNQPKGYYKRWGIFKATQSEFFKDHCNHAPIECYINGKEETIVVI